MSKIKLGYLAGLVDGEGYLGIRRCTTKNDGSLIPEFKPTMTICNTNYKLMEYLKANYSGSICKSKRQTLGWKPSYRFEFNRSEIRKVLPLIKSYLIIKHDQADLVMELFSTYKHTYPGFGYTQDELSIKELLHRTCLSLNKRGVEI